MSFGEQYKEPNQAPMAEINMIPLIDVMLVLLVIFMITAPMMTHAVKLDLPKASSQPTETKEENIQISIKREGDIYWNEEQVSEAVLQERMHAAAQLPAQPVIHLRADGELAYRHVATVLSDSAKAGLSKIAFVTDPKDE